MAEDAAVGVRSSVAGDELTASGFAARAEGVRAVANRSGQYAHSSGGGQIPSASFGDTQQSAITMAGSTTGAAPGESVRATLGPSPGGPFVLEDNKSYVIVVTAIARGRISGVAASRSFQQTFVASREGGLSIIEDSSPSEGLGSSAAASWTLTGTIGSAPDRFGLILNTGTTTSAVWITAKLEFVEILNI